MHPDYNTRFHLKYYFLIAIGFAFLFSFTSYFVQSDLTYYAPPSISKKILPIVDLPHNLINRLYSPFSIQEKLLSQTTTPHDSQETGTVLAATDGTFSAPSVINFNVSAIFNQNIAAEKNIDAKGNITAPNLIYSIRPGAGISVSAGQNPIIGNTGVISLGGATGNVALSAGSGISVDGTTINNTGILSLAAGTGISVSGNTITNTGITSLTAGDGISISGSTVSNSDRGSSQNIFKTISVSGQNSVTANSNTSTLTFVEGSGMNITTDSTGHSVTFAATGGGSGIGGSGTASYVPKFTNSSTLANSLIYDAGSSIGIGTTSPTRTFSVNGAMNASQYIIESGNGYLTSYGTSLNLEAPSGYLRAIIGGVERLRINTDGNVGIGVLAGNPVSLFSVGSTSQFQVDSTGAIATSTGITSSGTITFSGLSSAGIVHNNASGVLSTSALNLAGGASEIIGTLAANHGGTGNSSYTTGDLLYASNSTTLSKLAIGTLDKVLTSNGSIPVWASVSGSGGICPDCVVNDPTSNQTITATSDQVTGLIIAKGLCVTNCVTPPSAPEIFSVTNNAGTTKFLQVDYNGNTFIGGGFSVGLNTTKDPIAISPTAIGSSSFTGTITSLDLTGAQTWTFPNSSGTVCLNNGDCTGTGTTNFLSKWTSSTGFGNSVMYDDGSNIGIGTTTPGAKLDVNGGIKIGSGTHSILGAAADSSAPGGNLFWGNRTICDDSGNCTGTSTSIGGSGTANYMPIFTAQYTIGNSVVYNNSGNIGVNTTSAPSLFTVGSSNQFQVNSTGNIVKINNVTYSWPASQGSSNSVLTNNGSGTLTWAAGGGGGGSSLWSALQSPTSDLNLNMYEGVDTTTTHATTFTYGTATSTTNLFTMQDTAGNNGTGYLFNVASASSSSIKPFHVSAAGTEAITVLANGNVGIGATTPTYKLDVTGTLHTSGAITFDSTTSLGGRTYTWPGAETSGYVLSTNGSGALSWVANGGISGTQNYIPKFATAGSLGNSIMYETSNQIGVNTTSPNFMFQVNGSVGFTGTTAELGTGDGGTPTLFFLRGAAAAGTNIAGGDMYFDASNGTGTGGSGAINFRTAAPGSTGTGVDSLVVDLRIKPNGDVEIPNGKVSIGRTNPSFPLTFSDTLGDKISLYGNSGAHYGIGMDSGSMIIHTDSAGSDIKLGYGSYASFTENYRFKGNGLVGFGTNNPNAYFDVSPTMNNSTGFPSIFLHRITNTFTGSANIGTIYQVYNNPILNFSSGANSVDTLYGNYVGVNTAVGSVTNFYGQYIAGPANGTNRYGLVLDANAGNVGIGRTNPSFPLTFNDTLGDKISLYGNSGAHYGFGIQGSLLQEYADSGADIAFGTGSSSSFTENVRMKASGRVGIGTNNPQSLLDVNGGISVGSYAGANAAPSNSLIVSGNIGVGTVNPSSKLEVSAGNITVTSGNLVVNTSGNTLNFANADADKILFLGDSTKTKISHENGYILRLSGGGSGSGGSGVVAFNTAGSERGRFDANGNFGIGATSPNAALQVLSTPLDRGGYSLSSWNGTGNKVSAFFKSATNNGGNSLAAAEPALVLGREGIYGQAYGNFAEFLISRYSVTGANAKTQLDFALTNGDGDGVGTKILSLQSGGNVGIGTSTPNTFKLEVAGNIGPTVDSTGSGVGFNVGSSGKRYDTVYASNGTINTSDERLKTNIDNLGYGLDAIMKLRPVVFNWKSSPDGTKKLGLIAQEVQNIIPEVVKVGDDPNHTLGLYYSDLIPVTIKAIQEQEKLISSLSDKLHHSSINPIATESADFSQLTHKVDTHTQDITALQHRLDILESEASTSALLASNSAVLNTLGASTGISASDSASLSSLIVSGKSNFNDVAVTGSYMQGILTMNGLESSGGTASASINTLSGTLKLQSTAMGNIEFENAKITMDTSGNLKAETITTKKVTIDTSDSASATVGTGIITSGQNSVEIKSTNITSSSKIFTSLTTEVDSPISLMVLNKKSGDSFTVKIPSSLSKDITFDWWIIN